MNKVVDNKSEDSSIRLWIHFMKHFYRKYLCTTYLIKEKESTKTNFISNTISYHQNPPALEILAFLETHKRQVLFTEFKETLFIWFSSSIIWAGNTVFLTQAQRSKLSPKDKKGDVFFEAVSTPLKQSFSCNPQSHAEWRCFCFSLHTSSWSSLLFLGVFGFLFNKLCTQNDNHKVTRFLHWKYRKRKIIF